ncbi:MAG TPA: lipase family protein [Burkholderiales bacterium]|nr:lipase family protein [Burkholderiales bacterium]
MKNLFIAILLSLLLGCGAGKYPITDTTKNPPGTLEKHFLSATNDVRRLKESFAYKTCPDKTSDDNCKKNWANLLETYGFSSTKISELTDKVQAYRIIYSTPGAHNEYRSVSGGILIPNLSMDKIKGVILYYHPTDVSKHHIPSCFKYDSNLPSYCQGNTSYYGEELGIIASQGYIVVMPDYVGQGYDYSVIHPYILYPEVNAQSGLNMLTATKALLSEINFSNNLPKNLYISGFSEGASYALWTSKLLQGTSANILINNGLTLKNTIGISGAYDLKNAQLPMAAENISTDGENPYHILNTYNAGIAKPILVSYALSAYGFYDLNQEYGTLMRPEFFNCPTCNLIEGKPTIADLFNAANLKDDVIKKHILAAAATTGYVINKNNSARALIFDNILDENSSFSNKLINAGINNWKSTSPISLFYLNKDSVVTNLNSINAYNGIKALSGDNIIKFQTIDNSKFYYFNDFTNRDEIIDHSQSEIFSLIAALSDFK